MEYDIDVSASYCKPTQHEVFGDYLKQQNPSTINGDPILQKQVSELKEKLEVYCKINHQLKGLRKNV